MSGVTPIDVMVEGLKQAFEDFVIAYKNPLAQKSVTECVLDPIGTGAALLSWFTGSLPEHGLQTKLFEELKKALDSLSYGATAENKFFNYLFAYKLAGQLNRLTHKFLSEPDAEGKSVSPKSVAGRNFVPLYEAYEAAILEIIKGYRAPGFVLFRNIDGHIKPADLESIKSPQGAAYFSVLLHRLSEALWTEESQRVFFSESPEGEAEGDERDEPASAGAGSGSGSGSGAGAGGPGASATVVMDLVYVQAAPVADKEKTSEQAHGSTPVPGGAS